MNELNAIQRAVAAAYGGGDFAYVETLEECRRADDGLFTFIMIELSEKEDCTDIDEALRRMEIAQEELESVTFALERLQAEETEG